MAPKKHVNTARLTLSSLAQTPVEKPRYQHANLFTLDISVDNVLLEGADGSEYKALRVVFADGNSVVAGQPAKYHGLNTMTARAMAQMHMPEPPTNHGILEAVASMLPPDSGRKPYQHISWVWMLVGYSIQKASSQQAAAYVVSKTMAVLTQGFLGVNIQVPATDGKNAWQAQSAIEGNRARLVRQGTKLAGGTFEIVELINVRLRLACDLHKEVRNSFHDIAAAHPALITVVDIPPNAMFPVHPAKAAPSVSPANTNLNLPPVPCDEGSGRNAVNKRPASCTKIHTDVAQGTAVKSVQKQFQRNLQANSEICFSALVANIAARCRLANCFLMQSASLMHPAVVHKGVTKITSTLSL